MMTTKRLISSFLMGAGAIACASAAWSQSGTDVAKGDWPDYNGNMAAQRYSPLDQINKDNVSTLKVSWRFSTESSAPPPSSTTRARHSKWTA